MSKPCVCCGGAGHTASRITYNRMPGGWETCSRCKGSGVEPAAPVIHTGLVLRNVRSGKVWAVYGSYPPDEWGIHRMKPARSGGHYVWQIIIRPERELLDTSRWSFVGFGDAWDHDLMEADALRYPLTEKGVRQLERSKSGSPRYSASRPYARRSEYQHEVECGATRNFSMSMPQLMHREVFDLSEAAGLTMSAVIGALVAHGLDALEAGESLETMAERFRRRYG